MLENNKTSLTLMKDPENQKYIKYINVMYYYIWKLAKDKELKIN